MDWELAEHVAIPVAALAFGGTLLLSRTASLVGRTALYFGAQTGMNIYMKSVLSSSKISDSKRGMPAAFVVTALQQLTAFMLFMFVIIVSRATPWPYTPKALKTPKEWIAVVLFTSSFVLNIALNNYSLSLIPISINMVVRSCLPLSTFASQLFITWLGCHRGNGKAASASVAKVRASELSLMACGAASAILAVFAQHESVRRKGEPTSLFLLGVIACLVSNLSASLNLALAGLLGSALELNALDTTVYMSAPAVLFLLGPIFFIRHPVSWVGEGSRTDWEVLRMVLALSPATVGLACFSGVFALAYNILTYRIVHTLSAAHTAFAGSFNNAATILIATVVGLERLPSDPVCGAVLVAAVAGNMCAFAGYNMLRSRGDAMDADAGAANVDASSERQPMVQVASDTCDVGGARGAGDIDQTALSSRSTALNSSMSPLQVSMTCRSLSLDAAPCRSLELSARSASGVVGGSRSDLPSALAVRGVSIC
eukprot:TRINITY_DN38060_c0_g1_i1.p1 TRINITY_DN38060_c0_g1~~TRINITY_DN38060_c0_g1_i1.p1  ORF type:complete len:485 (+),score=88.95 TRINITY_DN38060_c0_g1_i1:109-1563(+)